MNENLTDMVEKETDETQLVFSEGDLDLPEPVEEEAVVEATNVTVEQEDINEPVVTEDESELVAGTVPVVSLGDWFETHHASFTDIKQVRLQVTGVDPKEDLVLTIPHESGEILEDDIPKRRLVKIDDANILPVLDLDGLDMKVFNNGFRIICQFDDNMFLKCYGVKTGLIVTFCMLVDEKLLPYAKVKVGKKDKFLELVAAPEGFETKGQAELDKEALVLLYRQVSGEIDDMTINADAVKLLSEKQDSIRDINHHVQIDNALIELLSR